MDWKVALVDTGDETLTGGRVNPMQPFVGDETCLLTYGDGVSNIDIDLLLEFHKSHGKMVTLSAVRPLLDLVNSRLMKQEYRVLPKTSIT